MTVLLGIAVVSAMTSSASAMEVPFWYETDLLTGEQYYVDHFDNGKKTWSNASPIVIIPDLEVQGIGSVIPTHATQDLADVPFAEKLTSQEIKNIKIQNEADRTYDLLATLYPGLYPVIERDVTVDITPISQDIIEDITSIIVVPEVISVPDVPEIVVPIAEPIPEPIIPSVTSSTVVVPEPIPEIVLPSVTSSTIIEPIIPEVIQNPVIPIPIPIVPEVIDEVVVPIPIPIVPEVIDEVVTEPTEGIDIRGDMTTEEWDQFLQDIVPADRPLQSIEDFFGE